MNLLGRLHERYVHGRRVESLSSRLAPLLPTGAHVLDVGCGDGQLTARVQALRPDVRLEGLDVLVRPASSVQVRLFDGFRLPYPDHGVDVVMLVDVLHHTEDPLVLLRESARVARCGVLLKDHVAEGLLARATLGFMDWIGNAHHGVVLPYNYWSAAQWKRAFRAVGLLEQQRQAQLRLYPGLASWLFDRSLHFVAFLSASSSGADRAGTSATLPTRIGVRT